MNALARRLLVCLPALALVCAVAAPVAIAHGTSGGKRKDTTRSEWKQQRDQRKAERQAWRTAAETAAREALDEYFESEPTVRKLQCRPTHRKRRSGEGRGWCFARVTVDEARWNTKLRVTSQRDADGAVTAAATVARAKQHRRKRGFTPGTTTSTTPTTTSTSAA